MIKVIYVNHKAKQCGVYEFGKALGLLLQTSKIHDINYVECDSFLELKAHYKITKPDVIIYNYHPTTMTWLLPQVKFGLHQTYFLDAISVGTIHEAYQEVVDKANNDVFSFHIALDPTIALNNPIVYKTRRLLPEFGSKEFTKNNIPTVGSFGFATPNKGFEKIIELVQSEFDEAVVNLNIPFSTFFDENGDKAKALAQQCRNLITKEKIVLNVDHSYLENDDLAMFLSKNDVNVFLYDEVVRRGISSATDWALASGRPIAISKSSLFRHLHHCSPSICVADSSLKKIIENGTAPIERFYIEYAPAAVLVDYERIIADIVEKSKTPEFKRNSIGKFYKDKLLRKLGLAKSATE